jgi:hypothetical protein
VAIYEATIGVAGWLQGIARVQRAKPLHRQPLICIVQILVNG